MNIFRSSSHVVEESGNQNSSLNPTSNRNNNDAHDVVNAAATTTFLSHDAAYPANNDNHHNPAHSSSFPTASRHAQDEDYDEVMEEDQQEYAARKENSSSSSPFSSSGDSRKQHTIVDCNGSKSANSWVVNHNDTWFHDHGDTIRLQQDATRQHANSTREKEASSFGAVDMKNCSSTLCVDDIHEHEQDERLHHPQQHDDEGERRNYRSEDANTTVEQQQSRNDDNFFSSSSRNMLLSKNDSSTGISYNNGRTSYYSKGQTTKADSCDTDTIMSTFSTPATTNHMIASGRVSSASNNIQDGAISHYKNDHGEEGEKSEENSVIIEDPGGGSNAPNFFTPGEGGVSGGHSSSTAGGGAHPYYGPAAPGCYFLPGAPPPYHHHHYYPPPPHYYYPYPPSVIPPPYPHHGYATAGAPNPDAGSGSGATTTSASAPPPPGRWLYPPPPPYPIPPHTGAGTHPHHFYPHAPHPHHPYAAYHGGGVHHPPPPTLHSLPSTEFGQDNSNEINDHGGGFVGDGTNKSSSNNSTAGDGNCIHHNNDSSPTSSTGKEDAAGHNDPYDGSDHYNHQYNKNKNTTMDYSSFDHAFQNYYAHPQHYHQNQDTNALRGRHFVHDDDDGGGDEDDDQQINIERQQDPRTNMAQNEGSRGYIAAGAVPAMNGYPTKNGTKTRKNLTLSTSFAPAAGIDDVITGVSAEETNRQGTSSAAFLHSKAQQERANKTVVPKASGVGLSSSVFRDQQQHQTPQQGGHNSIPPAVPLFPSMDFIPLHSHFPVPFYNGGGAAGADLQQRQDTFDSADTSLLLDRRERKNAQSRIRAQKLKDLIMVIKAKRPEDRTEEEMAKLTNYEERRLRKNRKLREKAHERKVRYEKLTSKSKEELTQEDKVFIKEVLAAKSKKNKADKLRRKRMKEMDFGGSATVTSSFSLKSSSREVTTPVAFDPSTTSAISAAGSMPYNHPYHPQHHHSSEEISNAQHFPPFYPYYRPFLPEQGQHEIYTNRASINEQEKEDDDDDEKEQQEEERNGHHHHARGVVNQPYPPVESYISRRPDDEARNQTTLHPHHVYHETSALPHNAFKDAPFRTVEAGATDMPMEDSYGATTVAASRDSSASQTMTIRSMLGQEKEMKGEQRRQEWEKEIRADKNSGQQVTSATTRLHGHDSDRHHPSRELLLPQHQQKHHHQEEHSHAATSTPKTRGKKATREMLYGTDHDADSDISLNFSPSIFDEPSTAKKSINHGPVPRILNTTDDH